MKNIIWVVVAILVIGGGVWYFNRTSSVSLEDGANNEATTTPQPSVDQPQAGTSNVPPTTSNTGRSITASFSPIAPINQTGTVKFSEYSATKTRVVVRVNNAFQYQPVHIHENTCHAPNGYGGIKWNLNPIRNGVSDTILGVSYNKLRTFGVPYSVIVHKSSSEMSVYTACADIPAL